MADVGRHFGLSRQRVHQILNKAEVGDRWLKQKNKDKDSLEKYGDRVRQAMERYRQGEYLYVVAKELGVPESVIDRFSDRSKADDRLHELAKFAKRTKVGTIPDGFDTPCLDWIGSYGNGYPIYCQNDNDRNAQRLAWFYATGKKVPVKGICGNKGCVNVDHLVEK